MDGALFIGIRTDNVVPFGAIVETSRAGMRKVSETIPLRARLCVERVQIIVSNILMERFDLVLERLASKGGLGRDIEREAAWCQISDRKLANMGRTSPVQYHHSGSPSPQLRHV
jgi:hypothetical protein